MMKNKIIFINIPNLINGKVLLTTTLLDYHDIIMGCQLIIPFLRHLVQPHSNNQ